MMELQCAAFARTLPGTSILRIGLLVASLGAVASCGDSSDGPPRVAGGPERPEGSGLELSPGSSHGPPEEDRSALLTILRGNVAGSGDQPYSIELVRTVDAELYRDVDLDSTGPTQRISRAKIVAEDGEVLWSDRVLTFFQLIEYLQRILDETPSVDFTVDQVYGFVEDQYPSLLEFPVRVPLGFERGSEYVLEVADDQGTFYEAGRFDLDELSESAEPPRFDASVETFEESGPPEDRLDVAILPDGYTSSQREEFMGDARAVVDRFSGTTPFAEHMDIFNFRGVWIPSEDSGASFDCRKPDDRDCNDGFVDTAFRYTFVASALVEELGLDLPEAGTRVAFPLDIAKIFEVAALTQFDEVIVLSNSDRRSGFGGMKVAILTTYDDRQNFPDVAVHEFGHSFGALGDEYYIETDPCRDLGNQAALPANIARFTSPDLIKWSRWIPSGTPLPTPDSLRDRHEIGAYEKAYNCSELYRPSFDCKMRSSSSGPFCAVCREHLTRQMYGDIDQLQPGYPKVEAKENGRLRFESGVRAGGDRTEIRWILDGVSIATGPVMWLENADLPSRWTKFTMEVRDDTGFVRKDDSRLRSTRSWWVRAR